MLYKGADCPENQDLPCFIIICFAFSLGLIFCWCILTLSGWYHCSANCCVSPLNTPLNTLCPL